MRKICWILVVVLLSGCTNKATNATIEEYNQVFERVMTLEQTVNQVDWATLSGDKIAEIYNIGQELYYDYNPMDLTPEQSAACEALKERINKLRADIATRAEQQISNFKISPWVYEDQLFDKTETFPVYLQRGEKLRWKIAGEKPITVKVCNADSRKVLKTYSGRSTIKDSLTISNTAIYFIEVNPNSVQYIDLDINYKINEMSRLRAATPVNKEDIECNKGDFGAKPIKGVSLQKCFEEPRKFTLRGQFKAAFSGSAKALVAVQVPTGTTDILYSMRIATSEQDKSSDGEFHENLATTYKKVKFLGLPLYEKEKNGDLNLFSKLLDDNRPLRDEDAYCNMYVFRNQAQAKQFQDGTKAASMLNYDVDYSTLGTQSCNGRIPVKGLKTIYLAFENERMRYTNYLWVEVEAVVPKTEYFTTKYSIE
ncbi:MAG: hypothetical protein IKT75_06450 [Alistipes sp.]|nr:hypothetical protein [Alistipes sp.]